MDSPVRMRARKIILIASFIMLAVVLLHGSCRDYQKEAFGTSPGTMTQLQTSHVPTEEDVAFYSNDYPRMVRREVTALTGGDPGEMRPWVFPWFGRGVAFVR